jgi:hypothetical protein
VSVKKLLNFTYLAVCFNCQFFSASLDFIFIPCRGLVFIFGDKPVQKRQALRSLFPIRPLKVLFCLKVFRFPEPSCRDNVLRQPCVTERILMLATTALICNIHAHAFVYLLDN